MKKQLLLLLICPLFTASAVSAAPKGIRVKNWKDIQTVDVVTLRKNIDSWTHRVVGVRFNSRGKDLRSLKYSWHQGSLWQPNPDGKGFASVQVMVAKKDMKTFKAITTDAQSPEVLTVYGEILRDSERQSFVFVRLMGRNATPDDKGGATITW